MSGEVLAGVDVGTTLTKAVLVTPAGDEVARGAVPTPWRTVPTGAEMDPDGFVDASLAALRLALGGRDGVRVLALGVTSLAETAVLLDARGRPVRPAIAWHDSRGAGEARDLASRIGAGSFTERTGLEPRALCTVAKHRWSLDHDPGAARAACALSVADWVVQSLGGDAGFELSLASRTGALGVESQRWLPDVLEWAGMPAGLLPEPRAASAARGSVSNPAVPPAARGAVLAVAGHDHLCAAVGAGVLADDEVFDSCGTAEALIRSLPAALPPELIRKAVAGHVTVGRHVLDGRLALLGGQRAGIALQRFLDLLGIGEEARDAIDRAALAIGPGAGGVRVSGQDGAAAEIHGIGAQPSPGAVWQAALEAVVRRSAELLEVIVAVGGPVRRIAAAGGWSRSRALRAAKSACLPHLEYPVVREAGARGAALIAGCAAGVYAGIDAVPRPPREG